MKHVQGLAARLRHFSPSNMLLRPTISWGFASRLVANKSGVVRK